MFQTSLISKLHGHLTDSLLFGRDECMHYTKWLKKLKLAYFLYALDFIKY